MNDDPEAVSSADEFDPPAGILADVATGVVAGKDA